MTSKKYSENISELLLIFAFLFVTTNMHLEDKNSFAPFR